jgi:16S rRNA processing protein RimM
MPEGRETPHTAWVMVARLGRTRGLRGEIYAGGSLEPEWFSELKRVWLRKPGGALLNGGEPLEVKEIRPYKGRLVCRFAGVDSIAAVEAFEHCEVVVPAAERPALDAGQYYLSDLVGCEVIHRGTGERLGTVTGWQEFGGPELLEVQADGARREDAIWIPFAKAICVEIDPARRRIVVDPPEGLLELNEAREAGPGPDR